MSSRVGQSIGNYRLIRLLGQGGFAEVYLGEHRYLGTHAAIKLLHTSLSEHDTKDFQNEARTIARLKHPHIIRILDFGVEEDTTPYLVMEYAPGGTLRARHPKGSRLELSTIVTYVKQIASALQYAHDQHIIHRDIKPANMLVGEQQEILLSDFGITVVVQSSRSAHTLDHVGTITYMAPEQIQAHPRAASDQYALGIVVYEWLTGYPPFNGSFTEVASKHCLVPPPSLREKIPTLTPQIEQVVMTALAKDPAARFGSVTAFATALEQAVEEALTAQTLPSSASGALGQVVRPVQAINPSSVPPTTPVSQSPTTPVSFHKGDSPPQASPGLPRVPAGQQLLTGKRAILMGVIALLVGSLLLFSVYTAINASRAGNAITAQSQISSTATSIATSPIPYYPLPGKARTL